MDDANQGSLGSCYAIAAISSLTEKTGLAKKVFLTEKETDSNIIAV